MPTRKASVFKPGYMLTHAGTSIPFGYAMADWRIANIADFPRLYAEIKQAWRDAGDVYDQTTQFRFPDGTRYVRGAAMIPGMSFDGGTSLATDVAGGQGFLPVISNGGRTVTGTFPTAPASVQFFAARSAATKTTGKFYFPFKVSVNVTIPGGFIYALMGLGNGTVTVHDSEAFGAGLDGNASVVGASAAGLTTLMSANHGQAALSGATLANGDIYIVYADFDARTWGVIDAAGTNHANVQAMADGTGGGHTMGMATGALSAYVDVLAFSTAAVIGITCMTTAELLAAGRAAPGGGYANAFDTVVTVGTRQGSNTTAGHALTANEGPVHNHPYYAMQNGGAGFAAGPGANFSVQTENTSDAGNGDPHSHDFQAPEAQFLVLVKV